MKTTTTKRYALKIGTTYLGYHQKLPSIPSAQPLTAKPPTSVLVPHLWPSKSAAQAVADHLRTELPPEAGDLLVVEHNLLTLK